MIDAAHAWLVLRSGACPAARNMAVDEALLHAAPTHARPVLRFYGWTEPAASFGYFQHYAEIEKLTHLRPLVRRPTGGGLVPHDRDWTYSLAIPPNAPWYQFSAVDSYHQIHAWIQSAFQKIGLTTDLAPQAHRAGPGQCFVGHEKSDLLWLGRKIAGAAQRRTRDGLLIQGSVQCPRKELERAQWEAAMLETAHAEWSVVWENFESNPTFEAMVQDLVNRRYGNAEYNRRR